MSAVRVELLGLLADAEKFVRDFASADVLSHEIAQCRQQLGGVHGRDPRGRGLTPAQRDELQRRLFIAEGRQRWAWSVADALRMLRVDEHAALDCLAEEPLADLVERFERLRADVDDLAEALRRQRAGQALLRRGA